MRKTFRMLNILHDLACVYVGSLMRTGVSLALVEALSATTAKDGRIGSSGNLEIR